MICRRIIRNWWRPLAARLIRNATLKTYRGFPHGMCTTHAAQINADLLNFIQS